MESQRSLDPEAIACWISVSFDLVGSRRDKSVKGMRRESRLDHLAIENDRHGQIFIALILECQHRLSVRVRKSNVVTIVTVCDDFVRAGLYIIAKVFEEVILRSVSDAVCDFVDDDR